VQNVEDCRWPLSSTGTGSLLPTYSVGRDNHPRPIPFQVARHPIVPSRNPIRFLSVSHRIMVRLCILGAYEYPTKPSIQSFRQERDTFGDLQVPAEKYWGAQTQRYVDYLCLFILTDLNAQIPSEL
jgi:hypothetical protein